MTKAALTNPVFTNEKAAVKHLEASRWPDGPYCPHCGSVNVHRMGGETQKGMFLCNDCRDKFTARVGTVLERSHIPVHKWLLAIHLLSSSKKGCSTHQLHRSLGITYKSAWFMAHRIREAMKPGSKTPPLGGRGKTVEADETYFGRAEVPIKRIRKTRKGQTGPGTKRAVLALVERGGSVRSFHIKSANADTIREALFRNVSRKSLLHTDESALYTGIGRAFADHDTVKHSAKEYVRGDVHTNTVEGFFSIFKRGMKGIYQHCSEAHLQRYLAEYDFRYNHRIALGIDDEARADAALKGIVGKRLTYRRTNEARL